MKKPTLKAQYLGALVELRRDCKLKSGHELKAGERFRVGSIWRGRLTLYYLDRAPHLRLAVRQLNRGDVTIIEATPLAPLRAPHQPRRR